MWIKIFQKNKRQYNLRKKIIAKNYYMQIRKSFFFLKCISFFVYKQKTSNA